ncbi:MAG: hypothetical protein L6Q97_03585 [Thermoanaerobaculia bacterium]|nr:hypothetical protein [Thermoanaerobaculia bacterium]
MKRLLFYATAIVLSGSLLFCKNNPASQGSTDELPADRTDSLVGLKGCDRAGFKAQSKTARQFIYQDFTVNSKDKEDGKGQEIDIVRTDSGAEGLTIVHEEPTYFLGSSRGQVFFEETTGPENRKLVVYHVKRRTLMFRYPFCGEMEVTSTGFVRFYTPVEESDMTEVPECPEKEKWEKEGTKVVYAQLCLFSLINRSLTRKSEYVCIPLK